MTNQKIISVLIVALVILGLANVPKPTPRATRLGYQMVRSGVIDQEKFLALYRNNPNLLAQAEALLSPEIAEININSENAGLYLNFFWALGLGNQNPILGMEMMDPRYGGPGNFASTGLWTLAHGHAMAHYNRHQFIPLGHGGQAMVDKVSRTIYRPCCANSAHFPDCNHGMAMLGYLEFLASRGASEAEMTEKANDLNSFWFPELRNLSCGVQ